MKKSVSPAKLIIVRSLISVFVLVAASPVRADLTGSQILERSKQAYKSLKSYRGTSHVVAVSTGRGNDVPLDTMAAVLFVRPAKVRVEGTLINGVGFAYISDGSHTWQTSARKAGGWEQSRNLDTAIGTFAGMSQSAASTMPSILLSSPVNDPLNVLGKILVARETLSGQMTYRLDASNKYTHTTFWVDPKTFLLVKLVQHTVLSKSGIKKAAAGGPPPSVVLDVAQTFNNVRANDNIVTTTFARPKGAP